MWFAVLGIYELGILKNHLHFRNEKKRLPSRRVSVNKPDGSTATKELLVSIRTKTENLAFATRPSDMVVDAGGPVELHQDHEAPSPCGKSNFRAGIS